MDMLFWGLTFGFLGKILLGVAVIRVHWRITQEHEIDKIVLRAIRRERSIASVAVLLMLTGYILEILFYGYLPF